MVIVILATKTKKNPWKFLQRLYYALEVGTNQPPKEIG